jgi:amidase
MTNLPTPPTAAEVRRLSDRHGLGLDDVTVEEYVARIGAIWGSYAVVAGLPEAQPTDTSGRDIGRAPHPEEDPLGTWAWIAKVEGSGSGALAGRTLAVKDNIAVAGLPLANGSPLLAGFVPDRDATVVTRALLAGATIVGKSSCEDLCLSGAGHTSATGPMRNPWDPSRASGGSSGGSAIAVATGRADLALGADQGGSVRIPASWCGIVGHKPTFGLVPYTGAAPIEFTLDHIGPMARTVGDVAALLGVIAGRDGMDSRQDGGLTPTDYPSEIELPADGIRVGVLEEGFGWPGLSDPLVDQTVRLAAARMRDAGLVVEDVSVPAHRTGFDIWSVIATEGAAGQMILANGYGVGHAGYQDAGYVAAFGRARTEKAVEFAFSAKLALIMGEHVAQTTYGEWYARARNAALELSASYDRALDDFDVLVLPTVPMTATTIPEVHAPLDIVDRRAHEMLVNPAPFDVTGHPAASIPCGLVGGMPVGLMIVGRRGADGRVLQVARAYERLVGGFASHIGSPPGS